MKLLFNNLDKLLDAPNGIEKARQLILQLAVQGKLVKQDPNDEPASELLKKIKKEKEKLIAESKIKKSKELPQIKDEEKPFKLPKGWIWLRNIELFQFERGNNPKDLNKIGGKYPYINIKAFEKGIIENYSDDENAKFCKSSDILIVCDGSRSGLIGDGVDGILGSTLAKIEPYIVSTIDYIKLFITSKFDFFNTNKKGAAIPHLDINLFKNIPFPLPPLNEQKRIVEKVNSLMALLDELEEKRERKNQKRIRLNNSSLDKLLTSKDDKGLKTNWKRIEEKFNLLYSVPENVAKLKQAILQLAVQGRLVKQDPNDEPASELLKKIKKEKEKLIAEGKIKKQKELPPITDEEKPFELPKGWEWTNIQNIAFVTKLAGFEYTKYVQLKDSGEVPVIRAQNVRMDRIDDTNLLYLDKKTSLLLHRSALTKPSILMTFIGAGIGDVAIFNKKERWHLAPNVAKIEPFKNDNDFIDLRYFLFYLMSPAGRTEIFSFQKSTAQPSLSMGTIRQVKFALPPLKEQKRIVEKVNELMSLCNTLEEKLKKKEEKGEMLVGAVVNGVASSE